MGWHSTVLQLPHNTTVCEWLNTVVLQSWQNAPHHFVRKKSEHCCSLLSVKTNTQLSRAVHRENPKKVNFRLKTVVKGPHYNPMNLHFHPHRLRTCRCNWLSKKSSDDVVPFSKSIPSRRLTWWNILGTWHPWKMSLETARVAWACASASPIPEGGATSQYRWKAPEHTQAQTLTSLKKLCTNKKWKQRVQNTNNKIFRTCPNVPKTDSFFLYKKEEQETAKRKWPWTQIQETLKPQCSLHCLKSLLNPFRTKSKGNMKEIDARHFRSYSCRKSKKRGVEGKTTTTTKIIIKSPVQPPQPEISGFS